MTVPRLILLTGIDGSGKTTVAYLVIRYLESNGVRTRYAWVKSFHSLSYIVSNMLRNTRLWCTVINPTGMQVRQFDPTYSKPFQKLWYLLELISVLPWIIVRIYLPLLARITVVADRYVPDTIVTISVRMKQPDFHRSFIGRLLSSLIPKGTVMVHLDASIDTVINRKPDIEYTRSQIVSQIKMYKLLAKKLSAFTVDTSKLDAKQTLEKVIKILEKNEVSSLE
jgi:thymidylate kinase